MDKFTCKIMRPLQRTASVASIAVILCLPWDLHVSIGVAHTSTSSCRPSHPDDCGAFTSCRNLVCIIIPVGKNPTIFQIRLLFLFFLPLHTKVFVFTSAVWTYENCNTANQHHISRMKEASGSGSGQRRTTM